MSENLINKLVIGILFFSVFAPLRADELVLKDGKTLHGTITNEDPQELTILLGSNMVLRVARNKVNKIIRASAPVGARPTVRMPSVTSVSTAAAVVQKSSAPAAAPKTAAVPPPVKPAEPVANAKSIKKGVVSLERTVLAGPVNWTTSWDGVPEKEGDQFKWKWAVLRATITSDAKARTDIYNDAAEAFADELSALRAPDEKTLRQDSARLFDAMKDKAAKKGKGYERRGKNSFDAPKK